MHTREKILRLLREYIAEKGYPPSIRELAKSLGFKSTKAVKVHLDRLSEMGLIRKMPHKARGIELVEKGFPIIGRVPAGNPVLMYENVEGYLDLSQWNNCYLLKVEGDSMIGAYIRDGDMVAVTPTKIADDGDIIVARVNDEVTVKRIKKMGNKYILKPENERYEIIEKPFEIVGKVIGLIRKEI